MSPSSSPSSGQIPPLYEQTVLLVGLGGLGCPAALALVEAGVGRLILCDDDVVDEGNLHRQILFSDADIGTDKLDAAQRALRAEAERSGTRLELQRTRFLPSTAHSLVERADLVVEGADNFATKFLAADVCHLEGKPIVHGAAIQWHGTAWSVSGAGGPCYRCLFEDIPSGQHASCESEGVVGPVVGMVGAMMAELALRSLCQRPKYGTLWTFRGQDDSLREVSVHPRSTCPLCGTSPTITNVETVRYSQGPCAA